MGHELVRKTRFTCNFSIIHLKGKGRENVFRFTGNQSTNKNVTTEKENIIKFNNKRNLALSIGSVMNNKNNTRLRWGILRLSSFFFLFSSSCASKAIPWQNYKMLSKKRRRGRDENSEKKNLSSAYYCRHYRCADFFYFYILGGVISSGSLFVGVPEIRFVVIWINISLIEKRR